MSVSSEQHRERVTLFLAGNVMTGRGIDQILPHPAAPALHEDWIRDARHYVELAERQSGPIPRGADPTYIWGEALPILKRTAPDLRLVNLETAVTTSDDAWNGKRVHYRMHPANVPCLSAAGIDCCVLANNHVLDWGYAGLNETLQSLADAEIATVGAGATLAAAQKPALFDLETRGRVLVFAAGSTSSGIPESWAAGPERAGVVLVDETAPNAASRLRRVLDRVRRPDDIVVVSLHWGPNWGHSIPATQRQLAHALIDDAGVDVVHGHSSHHVKGIEVYHDRPIFYGCGDLLTDYEGIGGYEDFRGDLGLVYLLTLEAATGRFLALDLHPVHMEQFQLRRAGATDAAWLIDRLNRVGQSLGTRVERDGDGGLTLVPD